MTGSGMVIFQPATRKVVVVYDETTKYWILPKGRKDVGESLEEAALREAYEEVRRSPYVVPQNSQLFWHQAGYRAQFFPLYTPTNAPIPPSSQQRRPLLNTEPFYMSTAHWRNRRSMQPRGSVGGEYLTFWYIGQIPEDAVWEANTGMSDEKGYRARLLTREEAWQKLQGTLEGFLVERAYDLWGESIAIDQQIVLAERKARLDAERAAVQPASSSARTMPILVEQDPGEEE